MANFEIVGFDNSVGLWLFPIAFRELHYTVNKIFTFGQDSIKDIWENEVLKFLLRALVIKHR